MTYESLLEKISMLRGESAPFPEDLEAFLADFIPNHLAKHDTFQDVFEVTESEMDSLYAQAFEAYQRGAVERSLELFRILIILNPFRPAYWLGLAGSFERLGYWEKALHPYSVLTFLEPKDPSFHERAAMCYSKLGQHDQEKLALEQAKRLKNGETAYV